MYCDNDRKNETIALLQEAMNMTPEERLAKWDLAAARIEAERDAEAARVQAAEAARMQAAQEAEQEAAEKEERIIQSQGAQMSLHFSGKRGPKALTRLVKQLRASFPDQFTAIINWKDMSGNTPLHLGCMSVHTMDDHLACSAEETLTCMRLILGVGADPLLENDAGDTPLVVSHHENKRAIAELLQAAAQMTPEQRVAVWEPMIWSSAEQQANGWKENYGVFVSHAEGDRRRAAAYSRKMQQSGAAPQGAAIAQKGRGLFVHATGLTT